MKQFNLQYTLILLWLCGASATALAEGFDWFQQITEQNGNVTLERMADHDDAIYLAGNSFKDGERRKGVLLKYSKAGTELWRRNLPVSSASTDITDLEVNQHGVYVAGHTGSRVTTNFIRKYNHDGSIGWTYTEARPSEGNLSIALDDEGINFLRKVRDELQIAVSRLDLDGNLLWSQKPEGVSGLAILATHDQIYLVTSAHRTYSIATYVYDTQGNKLFEFPIPDQDAVRDLTYYDGHLYSRGTSRFSKFDLAGNLVWMSPLHQTPTQHNGLAVREDGIYLSGHNFDPSYTHSELGMHLTHYDLDGNLQERWFLPGSDLSPTSVVVAADHIFVGGTRQSESLYEGFLGQFSTDALLPSVQIRSLNDANLDGYQDLALLKHNYGAGKVIATVKSVGAPSSLAHEVTFDTALRPIDFLALPDINGNSASELAVLSRVDSTAEIRDSLTGEKLSQLQFNRNFTPLRLMTMTDQNSNGAPELAVLETHKSTKWVRVEIRDSITAQLLNSVSFNSTYTPKDLVQVQDLDGDNRPELGVLSTNENNLTSKLEIRNLNGTLIKNLWLGENYDSIAALPLPPLTDGSTIEATALAALQAKPDGDRVRMKIAHQITGGVVRTVNFDRQFAPIKAIALNDINANGTLELALLGRNSMASTNKVEIRDSLNGTLVKNIWPRKDLIPEDMIAIPDINGNLSAEIGILLRSSYDVDTHKYSVLVRDAATGDNIDQVEFVFRGF
ncbi:hypothetical protein FT643_16220 [Ketobacter sp. MCCC 1A13808]|uniref:hypothetical protein n=1 Tax=Ketobacter sp. MCCC 1A13808 TaxID=2602738 RepID=UPI0012EC709E|nr:hypothetical protein [Ketobacter sp. MCCC 1A13808]MVF13688.1 hypothetical protein [Ketobacter sp. MCCC 1A13808]